MYNLNYDTNEPIYETETDPQTYRTDCGCQGGCVGIREEETGKLGLAMQRILYGMGKQQGPTV